MGDTLQSSLNVAAGTVSQCLCVPLYCRFHVLQVTQPGNNEHDENRGPSLNGHSQQTPPSLIRPSFSPLLSMYLLLPLTKGHLSNVASFLGNSVALLERDYCISRTCLNGQHLALQPNTSRTPVVLKYRPHLSWKTTLLGIKVWSFKTGGLWFSLHGLSGR